MKALALPLLICLLSAIGVAQQATLPSSQQSSSASVATTSGVDAAKVADIRRLLELTGTRDMVNQMKSSMLEQFRQNAPAMPSDMLDELMAELKAEDLLESMIPVYSRHFSGDEIKQLIAFYQSPFGQKLLREMPQIINESNEVGIQWGEGVITRVAGRWRDQGRISPQAYDQLVGTSPEHH